MENLTRVKQGGLNCSMAPKSIYRGMVRQFEESVIAHHVAGNEVTAANLEECRTKLLIELNKVIEGQRACAIQEGYSKAVTAAIQELREENARLKNIIADSQGMDIGQGSARCIPTVPVKEPSMMRAINP